ncbi:MAG: addiction module toxin RelE [Alphaproteobacteria bacterium RIFCSPLOWO2_01_FULL_40_26]|nr:MAG: addiction module toxin RelE [Alphaproteobacteria bacterium RIFCSPHIGHO2_02_FULL_40_34]OFW85814.1 MAG: addiction module toxin RelE [Alphaproteobacteria bacterium RIFCSPHIGHO2_01_FULL_40_8]OFW94843.1 MAG: addiction module toxin RelE [Alphaproteobacteria bacterium RIFCSPLOWO2_01_FULL_40_26]OFX10469.1 MAG: addiction module toxin RelE [Alphaproteobacteria bacterium RIFCSPLOWO2_02_FULL_40_19]OFX11043.1 MAG: addiction module toxin RelE [Alphaproteobacteria bacterium RIFCSPLOWO2_12_FULL_40_11]
MWKVVFEEKALKLLSKLDKTVQKQILKYLNRDSFLKNPKSFGKALLYEKRGNWRFRVGDYRVICRLEERQLIVLVLDLGHRREIYKKS